MGKVVVYPNFVGADVKDRGWGDTPVLNLPLSKLLKNEIFKDDSYFSSEKRKTYLKNMSKDIDKLEPIVVVKNPLVPGKFAILDGHHRFELFRQLDKKTIPGRIIDDSSVFLAMKNYGSKNNTVVRLDKIDSDKVNLTDYFNNDEQEGQVEEKWSEKYKKSINCDNPKGFSQRAHCQGRKKKMKESEMIKGGLADDQSLYDLAIKHSYDDSSDTTSKGAIKKMYSHLKTQLAMGVKVEIEHTNDEKKAKEIAMDHLSEDPNYYTKLKKIEAKEMTGADSAGAYSAPAFSQVIKKKHITKIHNMTEEQELDEVTDASSSGAYDVPLFGGAKGRKNPLSIGGPDTIYQGRAVKDKNFPKWGGPGGKFVKIKDKCKKFPYCNQGDINALELMETPEFKQAIEETAKKYGLPIKEVEKIVLNQIK